MTAQEIINLSRFYAHIDANQISDANMLPLLNVVYKSIGRDIMTYVDENYFYEKWVRDAIASQPNGEYLYPEADSNSIGAVKILDVYIKPTSTTTNYLKATEIKESNLIYGWDYYLINQPKSSPIFYIADKSIFIAPQFNTEDVGVAGNQQILLTGYKKFIDLTLSSVDSDIFLDDDLHNALALGIVPLIYLSRGQQSEYINAMRIFDGGDSRNPEMFPSGELGKHLARTNSRRQGTVQFSLPNENRYQYG